MSPGSSHKNQSTKQGLKFPSVKYGQPRARQRERTKMTPTSLPSLKAALLLDVSQARSQTLRPRLLDEPTGVLHRKIGECFSLPPLQCRRVVTCQKSPNYFRAMGPKNTRSPGLLPQAIRGYPLDGPRVRKRSRPGASGAGERGPGSADEGKRQDGAAEL